MTSEQVHGSILRYNSTMTVNYYSSNVVFGCHVGCSTQRLKRKQSQTHHTGNAASHANMPETNASLTSCHEPVSLFVTVRVFLYVHVHKCLSAHIYWPSLTLIRGLKSRLSLVADVTLPAVPSWSTRAGSQKLDQNTLKKYSFNTFSHF